MTDIASRRTALGKLGLLALAGYVAPTVLELPGATANAKSRSRSRKRSAPKRKKAKGRKAKARS